MFVECGRVVYTVRALRNEKVTFSKASRPLIVAGLTLPAFGASLTAEGASTTSKTRRAQASPRRMKGTTIDIMASGATTSDRYCMKVTSCPTSNPALVSTCWPPMAIVSAVEICAVAVRIGLSANAERGAKGRLADGIRPCRKALDLEVLLAHERLDHAHTRGILAACC